MQDVVERGSCIELTCHLLLIATLVTILTTMNSSTVVALDWRHRDILNVSGNWSESPSLLLDSIGRIWLFWKTWTDEGWQIRYSTSVDWGNQWVSEKVVPGTRREAKWTLGNIRATEDKQGNIWLVWDSSGEGRSDVYYSIGEHYASSWTKPSTIGEDGWKTNPTVTGDLEGSIWVCWSEKDEAGWNLRLTHTDDTGRTWAQTQPLTSGPAWNSYPCLLSDPRGAIWLSYASDRLGENDIWLAELNLSVGDWKSHQLLGATGSNDGRPSMALGGDGRLWVAWEGRNLSTHNNDIIIVELVPTEESVLVDWQEILGGPGYDTFPALLRDGSGFLWLVWCSGKGDKSYMEVSVSDVEPPSVRSNITENTFLHQTIAIDLSISDNDALSHARVVIDDQEMAVLVDPPYVWSWNTAEYLDGEHELLFEAFDRAGNWEGARTHVWVDNTPPKLDVLVPIAGRPQEVVQLSARAWDTEGVSTILASAFGVTGLAMEDDGKHGDGRAGDGLYGVGLAVPKNASDGRYKIVVEAMDLAGNSVTDSADYIVDNTPPIVREVVIRPEILTTGNNIEVLARVDDPFGIKSVQANGFPMLRLNDTHWLGWLIPLNIEGIHLINVTAEDFAGNGAFDASRSYVLDNSPPELVFVTPHDRGTVNGSAKISLQANDEGGIARIELFANNSLLQTMSNPPYEIIWNATLYRNGLYEMEVRGFDEAGNLGKTRIILIASSRRYVLDVDGDGKFDSFTDRDGDSTYDDYEGTSSARIEQHIDADFDGIPDFLIDQNLDGIPEILADPNKGTIHAINPLEPIVLATPSTENDYQQIIFLDNPRSQYALVSLVVPNSLRPQLVVRGEVALPNSHWWVSQSEEGDLYLNLVIKGGGEIRLIFASPGTKLWVVFALSAISTIAGVTILWMRLRGRSRQDWV